MAFLSFSFLTLHCRHPHSNQSFVYIFLLVALKEAKLNFFVLLAKELEEKISESSKMCYLNTFRTFLVQQVSRTVSLL